MTLPEFYDLLAKHDWYFDYSDDFRVWQRGQAERQRIRTIAKESVEHNDLFRAFYAHYFNGPAWSTERQPLPERPTDSIPPHPEADPTAIDPNQATAEEF